MILTITYFLLRHYRRHVPEKAEKIPHVNWLLLHIRHAGAVLIMIILQFIYL